MIALARLWTGHTAYRHASMHVTSIMLFCGKNGLMVTLWLISCFLNISHFNQWLSMETRRKKEIEKKCGIKGHTWDMGITHDNRKSHFTNDYHVWKCMAWKRAWVSCRRLILSVCICNRIIIALGMSSCGCVSLPLCNWKTKKLEIL